MFFLKIASSQNCTLKIPVLCIDCEIQTQIVDMWNSDPNCRQNVIFLPFCHYSFFASSFEPFSNLKALFVNTTLIEITSGKLIDTLVAYIRQSVMMALFHR